MTGWVVKLVEETDHGRYLQRCIHVDDPENIPKVIDHMIQLFASELMEHTYDITVEYER